MLALDRTYFLDVEVWREYGLTDTNTDVKKLKPIIYAVQRTRIEQVIGTTLYNKLVTDIKAGTITGLYETLLKEHIIPTMIVYCDWKASIHTTTQITNKTTGKFSDTNIQAGQYSENNKLRDELLKDAKTLEQKMKGWLCDNWENIPELYQAVDNDLLSQTIRPHLHKDSDYTGNIMGII
jgi:hypothetical protein